MMPGKRPLTLMQGFLLRKELRETVQGVTRLPKRHEALILFEYAGRQGGREEPLPLRRIPRGKPGLLIGELFPAKVRKFPATTGNILLNDQCGERKHIGLQKYQHTDQCGKSQTVEENSSQDIAFMPVPVGCGTGDNDTLSIDHFPHDAA
jgi:hypothetical protein